MNLKNIDEKEIIPFLRDLLCIEDVSLYKIFLIDNGFLVRMYANDVFYNVVFINDGQGKYSDIKIDSSRRFVICTVYNYDLINFS